jgi:site-specific DNA-methyltransferase (adenine-specific)
LLIKSRLIHSIDNISNDDVSTPNWLYQELDDEFHFNDDPCPLYGKENEDGLLREWGTKTFVNPPYSKPHPWCEKAVIEARRGKIVVMLLRVDTSTKWFHEFVLPFAEIRWVKGRVKFDGKKPAPFASMVAIYTLETVSRPSEQKVYERSQS